MAYVLRFFTADGCMIKNKRGAHFIEFQITDGGLLGKIKKLFESNLKITERKSDSNDWKKRYRLQIGSKKMFGDLLNLGITPNKSKSIELPKIPNKYFCHFVRGYFDGDGNVFTNRYWRSDRNKYSRTLLTGFTSGSKAILESLRTALKTGNIVSGGSLCFTSGAHRLTFSVKDSGKLFKFMYANCGNLFLAIKKRKYDDYFKRLNLKLGR